MINNMISFLNTKIIQLIDLLLNKRIRGSNGVKQDFNKILFNGDNKNDYSISRNVNKNHEEKGDVNINGHHSKHDVSGGSYNNNIYNTGSVYQKNKCGNDESIHSYQVDGKDSNDNQYDKNNDGTDNDSNNNYDYNYHNKNNEGTDNDSNKNESTISNNNKNGDNKNNGISNSLSNNNNNNKNDDCNNYNNNIGSSNNDEEKNDSSNNDINNNGINNNFSNNDTDNINNNINNNNDNNNDDINNDDGKTVDGKTDDGNNSHNPEDGKTMDGKTDDGKTIDDKTDDSKTMDGKTDDGKTINGKTMDGKMDDGKTINGKTMDGKTMDGKTDDSKTIDGETDDSKTIDLKTDDGKTINGKTMDGKMDDGNNSHNAGDSFYDEEDEDEVDEDFDIDNWKKPQVNDREEYETLLFDVRYDLYLTGKWSWDCWLNVWHMIMMFMALCLLGSGWVLRHFLGTYIIMAVKGMPQYTGYTSFIRKVPNNQPFYFTGYIQEVGDKLMIVQALQIVGILAYMAYPLHRCGLTLPILSLLGASIAFTEMNVINVKFTPQIIQTPEMRDMLLSKLLNEYSIQGNDTFSISYDYLSIWLQCCGIETHLEFQKAHLTFAGANKNRKRLQVPPACCRKRLFKTVGPGPRLQIVHCMSSASNIYTTGCFVKLTYYLHKYCTYYNWIVLIHLFDCALHGYLYKMRVTFYEKALRTRFGVSPDEK